MSTKRWVVLLRGINVGGRNKLPMADLRAAATDAGFDHVVTYIQSGNLLVSSTLKRADVALAVEELISDSFGLTVPAVVRSPDDLAASIAGNPYLDQAENLSWLHTFFLRDEPDAEAVASLDQDRSPPDVFQVVGSDVYVHYVAGVANSKVTGAWLDKQLATVATARNAKTVAKLLELSAEQAPH